MCVPHQTPLMMPVQEQILPAGLIHAASDLRCRSSVRSELNVAPACRHDINVPFIVAGPGIKPNTVVTHLAANYDLAPTWLQLAGISYNPAYAGGIGAPSGAQHLGIAGGPPFDGKSLVPLLHGEHDRVQPTR